MNFIVKALVTTTFVLLNISNPANSQESVEEQIRSHLEKMPELRDQLFVLPGSAVSIPTAAKRNARFNFALRRGRT